MATTVTIESCANSILGWSEIDLKNFNGGDHPWSASRSNQVESAPNSPEEVVDFLGDSFGEKSYQINGILKAEDAKLGFVLEHDPCE